MKITLNGKAHDIADCLTLERIGSGPAIAMELGCGDALMNTAFAGTRVPVLMAHAMKLAIQAGRAELRAALHPTPTLRFGIESDQRHDWLRR